MFNFYDIFCFVLIKYWFFIFIFFLIWMIFFIFILIYIIGFILNNIIIFFIVNIKYCKKGRSIEKEEFELNDWMNNFIYKM